MPRITGGSGGCFDDDSGSAAARIRSFGVEHNCAGAIGERGRGSSRRSERL